MPKTTIHFEFEAWNVWCMLLGLLCFALFLLAVTDGRFGMSLALLTGTTVSFSALAEPSVISTHTTYGRGPDIDMGSAR